MNDYNDESTRTLYIGNIGEGSTEDHLYELFLQAGPVVYIKIPVDKVSKKAKNFAFVCYQHECSVPYAVHLFNNIKLFGKNLRVQLRDNSVPLKSIESVGIHTLDPDFLGSRNGQGSLVNDPQPLMPDPHIISSNFRSPPYMGQNNPYYGNLNVPNFCNYQYNQGPYSVDTRQINMFKNYNENNYERNRDHFRRNDSYSSPISHRLSYNHEDNRGERHHRDRDRHSGNRQHHRSNSHRSNESFRDDRYQPYDRYSNSRNNNRY